MFAYADVDQRVSKLHHLKRTEPAPGKTVRVEDYASESNLFGDGVVFIWDQSMSPPRSDGEMQKTSVVEGYRSGEDEEGVWVPLGLVSPEDQGIVVANPKEGPSRGFTPALYESSDEAIDAATSYVNENGGGAVSVPREHLPVNYFVVSVASGVELVAEGGASLSRLSGEEVTAHLPGTVVVDTSEEESTLSLGKELEIDGTEIKVRRSGGNLLEVQSESNATIAGGETLALESDRETVTLVYDRKEDHWLLAMAFTAGEQGGGGSEE
jgi:hypothetical protein